MEDRTISVASLWFEPATRAINDRLYRIVVSECGPRAWKAAEDLIQRNVGLVIYKVDQHIAFYPALANLREDLNSAGYVGLCEAVNKMIEDGPVENANPTGLMSIYILKNISETIEHEVTVRVPRRSRQNADLPNIIPIESVPDDALSFDPRSVADLRETLDACCEDDLERDIIAMRERGAVDREIAQKHGMSLTTIYVLRRNIYARFLELTGWKGEP